MAKEWVIPDKVLIPAANEITKATGKTAPYWNDHEIETVKLACGPDYGHVPIADIRGRCENLRKSYKLERRNGHAPVKVATSDELRALYDSDYWREFGRKIREAWQNKCAICYAARPLEVHHRTYERIGAELKTDVIPVCKHCHKFCDKQRRRESGQIAAEALEDCDDAESPSLFDATV